MPEPPHVRLGDYLFAVVNLFDESGIRPMRQRWRSIFADKQGIPGAPGYQNLRPEILPWVATSFAGGEGQRVIDPTDEDSFRAFDRAQTIDFSNPGEMRLARQMVQQGTTGAVPTTVEGSAWVDDVGVSTVVGTDRRLNAQGDAVKTDIALTAGQWQIDFYAYSDPSTTIEGSALLEEKGNTTVVGTDIRLKSEKAKVRTTNRTPALGRVTVGARFVLPAPSKGAAHATAKLEVFNQTRDEKIAEVHARMRARGGEDDVATPQVTFKAKSGQTYRYKVTLGSISNANYLAVDYLTEDERETKTLKWEVKDGAAVVASGTADMGGITSSQRVASATVVVAGAVTYTLRVVRQVSLNRPMYVDKGVFVLAVMNDPRVIHFGRKSFIWLFDFSASALVRGLYWDAGLAKWVSVGTVGANGDLAVAAATSDAYEFVALSDKKVYRFKEPATSEVYTAALGDTIEGIAVGGSRLLILTESQANGTVLYDTELEGTPPVTPTQRYAVGNKGIVTAGLPQRMAATRNGAVFFANHGPDCWVYSWDGSAGVPLAKLPTGFNGRAIVHANGVTWVGGGFPAVDPSGNINQRPAIFIVDHSTGEPVQLDIRLYRDEDPVTVLQFMQLFGSDVYVVCDVKSTPKKLRVWRISLRPPIAPFLDQEITLDETQASGTARGLAMTGQDSFVIWSKGGPYRRLTTYNVTTPAVFTSSRYDFGLDEKKRLDEIEIQGVIPAGTRVLVLVETDDSGEFNLAADLTAPGKVQVSSPEETVKFKSLRYQVQLISTDPNATPNPFRITLRAYAPVFEKAFLIMLNCFDQNAVWHLEGQQARGVDGLRYLRALTDTGALVEFEDRYSSKRDEEAESFVVYVQDIDAFYVDRGEAYVLTTLVERVA